MIKVLLADDDFLVRAYLSQLIDWERNGFTLVGAAQDGEEALQMVEEYHPHILITDISMPVLDGISVIRLLRSRGEEARIVVLSCHDDFEYVKEAMRLGADEYVLKNLLTEKKLLELLEQLKGRIRVSKEDSPFRNAEQERDYYIQLLRNEDGSQVTKDGFHISAAMAVQINKGAEQLKVYSMEQRETFDTSVAQVCRESCKNIPVRCIHVRKELYAVLLDLNGIVSVYERQQLVQQSASTLLRYIERYLALDVQIGTSKVYHFHLTPAQCWREAMGSLNEHFYHNQSIFFGWQSGECGREIPMEARIFCEKIAEYMDKKDSNAIRFGWAQALASFEHDHTEARLVREWLRQTDRSAGIELRNPPEQFSDLDGFELKYLTFREELLPQEQQYSDTVSSAVRYIQNHFDRKISLSEVAQMVHLNATYLSHIFHKETGVTFSEYLMSCRVNKAKDLLINTNTKVKEISMLSGFTSHRNFIKMFKNVTGMTPQEYRKKAFK